MSDEATYYLMTIVPILLFKLALLWAGVSIVRMGYELLLRGVTGEFKFQGGFSGAKADLVSASPGLLFALLGVVLLAIGALSDKPFSMETTTAGNTSSYDEKSSTPPPFPSKPPGLKEN